jgi:hypothetical protein
MFNTKNNFFFPLQFDKEVCFAKGKFSLITLLLLFNTEIAFFSFRKHGKEQKIPFIGIK